MRAVVLAAGFGTRLGPLTTDRAKPALMVGDRPLVAHVVANLADCGFDEIAVNLHFRAEQVRSALGDGTALGVRIGYFEEDVLLGTAGALAPMREFLRDEPFLIQHADVVTDHDLGGMLERHVGRSALLTMLVHERAASNSVVAVDSDWRVQDFVERPTDKEREAVRSPWVNSGVYACAPSILGLVPAPPSDFARDVVPRAVASHEAFAEPLDGDRCAIDSPERLRDAERLVRAGRLLRRPG
jgi:NDP-sugar pyrophosphorylase family protein